MTGNISIKKIDRPGFFASVKASLFGGPLSQRQVDGMNAIIDEFERRMFVDLRWLAYMLATAFHETGRSMAAIEEYGKGKGYDYGKKLKRSRAVYQVPDKLYYGRGLVQLTWFENYQSMGSLIKVDLLNHPELALDINIAVKIMFEGMLRGYFTGHSLQQHFSANTEDWINARKIINGLDKAEAIAGYAQKFNKALQV